MQLAETTDLEGMTYIPDLKEAAALAVRLAGSSSQSAASPIAEEVSISVPVMFSQDGGYERTAQNMRVEEGDSVMILGTGKAVSPSPLFARTTRQMYHQGRAVCSCSDH